MASDSDKKRTITIRNWDKYQRALKGRAGANSRRSWVAMSVDLDSDPDFFSMKLVERECWQSLLRHAGKVGATFDLSPSDCRVMFNLPRSPSFEVLINHGFIESHAPTRQTRQTRQTLKGKEREKFPDKPKKAIKKPIHNPDKSEGRFPDFWAVYPKKKARQESLRIWIRDNLDAKAGALIADVNLRKKGDRLWIEGYAPHPSTYLNQQRWTDDMEPARKEKAAGLSDDQLLQRAKELGIHTLGKNAYQLRQEVENK